MNREEYLNALMHKLAPLIEENLVGGTALIDMWRVSCGWPLGRSKSAKRGAIGQCFSESASRDGLVEMYLSPTLSTVCDGEGDDDSVVLHGVGATLLHEMCHAALGTEEGHGKAFKRLATAVGLAGPVRSTHASPELNKRLKEIEGELGAYPHAPLSLQHSADKPQTTRLIKAQCFACGYTIRLTQRWISVGLPVCPCGTRLESKA